MRIELNDDVREQFIALLDRTNGNRKARRLSIADLEAVIETALRAPIGYAWRSAGDSADARSLTAVCLAVRLDDEIVVSASSARGSATPASAWHDVTSWNVVNEGANALIVRAWARRHDADRIRIPLHRDEPRSNEESLRLQIVANPDDDAPRQVLADLLIERGDPRGEFIALQLQLEHGRDVSMAARADELLKAHAREWVGLSRTEVIGSFRRGFIEGVQVLDPQVTSVVSRLCSREPVRELHFVSPRRFEMHSLVLASWLPRIRSIEFSSSNRHTLAVNADALEVLLASPSVRKLERLILRDQPLGDQGATIIANHAPPLTSLVLDNAELTARGARTLAGIRWLNRLRELSLANNAIQVQGVEALVGNGSGRQWKSLDLSGTAMGNAGAFVLSRASRMTGLETLLLARNRIGPNGLKALLEAPHFKSLKDVEFSGNPIASAGRAKLMERFGPAPHRVE